jgi:hypothetical protein
MLSLSTRIAGSVFMVISPLLIDPLRSFWNLRTPGLDMDPKTPV